MKHSILGRLRVVIASTLAFTGLAVAGGGSPASAWTSTCNPDTTACIALDVSTWEEAYVPGKQIAVQYKMTNISGKWRETNATLKIDLPAGVSYDTSDPSNASPTNSTITFNPTTRQVTLKAMARYSPGFLTNYESYSVLLWFDVDKSVDVPSLTISSKAEGSRFNLETTYGDDIVLPKAEPYILETETSFSPSSVASGGTSTLTSKITNTGTGKARSIYFYVYIDDRLTVNMASVPSDCDYRPQETWNGNVYPQHLSCDYSPALAPGQSVQFSLTVTAPTTVGPEEYEASTELSCTSPEGASYDGTDAGDSVGILRLNPPVPAELHVVQMGGPKPITMPDGDAEPLQPTAGKTHSLTTYVYNVGGSDIGSTVSVVLTIPSGFTPTSMTATTDDGAASAPTCDLATKTCVFTQLAAGKQGKILVEGTLAPSIAHNSQLSVSASASAASLTDASDSAKIPVTAFADAQLSMVADGPLRVGSAVGFSLSVANTGPSGLVSSTVKVTIPAGASFVTVPAGCVASGTTMTCTWTKLDAENVDAEVFSVRFPSTKASVTAVLTTSTPLSKDSVTTLSVSKTLAPAVLPATGSRSQMPSIIALLLIMSGAALVVPARRRRTL